MKKTRLFTSLTLSLGLLFAFTTTAFAATTRYEAENAKLNGGAKSGDGPNASGQKYVGDNNIAGTDSIEFTVNVADAGEYTIEVGYGTDNDDATGDVIVNGTNAATLSYPKTSWLFMDTAVVKTASTKVNLKAGDNTVVLAPKAGSVNIDFIDVKGGSTETTTTTSNPKTGDFGAASYLALAGLSSAGLFFSKRKKK